MVTVSIALTALIKKNRIFHDPVSKFRLHTVSCAVVPCISLDYGRMWSCAVVRSAFSETPTHPWYSVKMRMNAGTTDGRTGDPET